MPHPFIRRGLLVGFLLVGFILGYLGLTVLQNNRVDLVIDAAVSEGRNFEVYINHDWAAPFRQPVQAGTRTSYVFKNVPGKISHLRLDPTDVAHAHVEIYGVEFVRNGAQLAFISPAELATWQNGNLTVKLSNPQAPLEIFSTSDDPILANENFVLNDPTHLFGNVLSAALKYPFVSSLWLMLAAVAGYQLFLSNGSDPRRGATMLGVLLVAAAVGQGICTLLIKAGADLPPVNQAIGYDAYAGISKANETRGAWGAALVGIFVTALGGWLWRRRRSHVDAAGSAPPSWIGHPRGYWFPVVMAVAYALVSFPPLHLIELWTSSPHHGVDYDSQNFLIWSWFRHLGLIPLRDFWLPYSGLYYCMLSPFPPDVMYFWAHRIVLFTAILWSCYELLPRTRTWFVGACLGMFWMILGPLVGTERYLISASVVLVLACCLQKNSRRLFLVGGAYAFYAFYIEASQVIYAAPACALLLAAALAVAPSAEVRRQLLRGFGGALVVAGSLLVLYLLNLWRLGALKEFVKLWLSLGSLADYTMVPASILVWFDSPHTEEGALWLLTLLLLLFGTWQVGSKPRNSWQLIDFVPLALAVVCFLAFQKQMIRPHIALQLMVLPIFGWIFVTARVPFVGFRGGETFQPVGFLVTGLVLFGVTWLNPGTGAAWKDYLSRSLNFSANLELAFAGHAKWYSVRATHFFPETFSVDGVPGPEFKAIVQRKLSFQKPDDLFVLGDDANLYILLGQTGPFYVTLYNQSILYSQQTTVEWLDQHQPKYVFWRPDFRIFDRVPNEVRVPLVYARVIRDYAAVDQIGAFTVLQRKPRTQPVDLAFWRAKLGDTIDLGFIPSRADLPAQLSSGSDKAATPATYAVVTVSNPVQGRQRELVFHLGGMKFSALFQERRKHSTYNIRLDRLWFWAAARPSSGVDDPPAPSAGADATVEIRPLALAKDVLY